jgi:hypothetical protein
MASTIKVIDAKDGTVQDVAPEAAQAGFVTGALRLPKDINVPLTGPDGKTTEFRSDGVAEAILKGGFSFADSKAQARLRAEDNKVLAFSENLANELVPLPGLVHGIQRLAGVDPEDLEARAESGWGKGGQYLGIAGSFLTGGIEAKAATSAVKAARALGSEAAEQAVGHSPGLLARAFGMTPGAIGGQVAADAATALEGRVGRTALDFLEVPDAVQTAIRFATPGAALDGAARSATSAAERVIGDSIQSDMARKAIAAGLGRAVEGASYGVGHAIDEAALGRADLNAERLLRSAGSGALIGGLRGAAAGAIGETAKKAVHNYISEDITSKLAGNVIGHVATGGTGGAVVGRAVGQRIAQAIHKGADSGVPALQSVAEFLKRSDDYLASKITALAGRAAPQYRPPIGVALTRTTQKMFDGSQDERRDAYDQRVQELTALQDPAVYGRHADQEVGELGDSAPEHAMATSQLGQKIIGFLVANVPPPQVGSTGQMNQLFNPKSKLAGRPDDRAIRDFADLDRLVQNPNHIFELADKGLVRPVHVKALQTLYPQTFQRIQAGLMEDLPNRTEDLTEAQRRSIKVLLGGETVSPQTAALRQQVFVPQPTDSPQPLTPAQNSKAIKASQTLSQNLEFDE